MANLTLSGYLATAQTIAWASGTSLTSLTDNNHTSLSDEIDNSTNKYAFADIYIELGSAAFTGTDSGIEVYIVPSVDGTNYPTWTGNTTSDKQEHSPFFVGFVYTTASTAAQKMVLPRVQLYNGKFKFAFRNRGNVTLASSANTAYWRPHSFAG